jgi:hypothetical protein
MHMVYHHAADIKWAISDALVQAVGLSHHGPAPILCRRWLLCPIGTHGDAATPRNLTCMMVAALPLGKPGIVLRRIAGL